MSILEGVQSHYRLFGFYGVFLVAKARLLRKPLEIAVDVDGIIHPVYLRLRTTDTSLLEEIIVNSEYQFEPSRMPRIIIDAGANIGLTSVFFANKFPKAKIFSIEPEQSNFDMLKKNTALYSNIVPIHGALWKEETKLNLSNPGTGNWGYQTQDLRECDAPEEGVRAFTVDKLMEQYDCNYIDILKIDIEGAEKEVFETSESWIDRVGVVIVELHDHFKSGCSRSVYNATKNFEFEWRNGETTFFVSKKYMPNEAQLTIESNSVNAPPIVKNIKPGNRILDVIYLTR